MKQLISSNCIFNVIKKSINCEYENKNDTYGVINFNFLKMRSHDDNNYSVCPDVDFEKYLITLATQSTIDPDEYNYLKEVKLKCFNKFINEEPVHRVITVSTYESINSRLSESNSLENNNCKVFLYQQNMNNYKNIISTDTAFVIFANKQIGGLILTTGCAQEEIKFLQNPELLYLKICQSKLDNNRVIVVENVKKYNSISGYGFDIEYVNYTGDDCYETIILMDAYDFSLKPWLQYDDKYKNREIRKCLTAFSNVQNKNIITGDWGCGAFKGNHELKFIIQLYCAKACAKNLYYFSYSINSNHVNKYSNCNVNELAKYIKNFKN